MSQTADEWLAQARRLRLQGQNKKAIQAFKKALELDPNNVDALNEMGLTHVMIGEQSEAIAVYDMAIALRPDDPRAYINKAEAYLSTGSFPEAFSAAEEGLARHPQYGS